MSLLLEEVDWPNVIKLAYRDLCQASPKPLFFKDNLDWHIADILSVCSHYTIVAWLHPNV